MTEKKFVDVNPQPPHLSNCSKWLCQPVSSYCDWCQVIFPCAYVQTGVMQIWIKMKFTRQISVKIWN